MSDSASSASPSMVRLHVNDSKDIKLLVLDVDETVTTATLGRSAFEIAEAGGLERNIHPINCLAENYPEPAFSGPFMMMPPYDIPVHLAGVTSATMLCVQHHHERVAKWISLLQRARKAGVERIVVMSNNKAGVSHLRKLLSVIFRTTDGSSLADELDYVIGKDVESPEPRIARSRVAIPMRVGQDSDSDTGDVREANQVIDRISCARVGKPGMMRVLSEIFGFPESSAMLIDDDEMNFVHDDGDQAKFATALVETVSDTQNPHDRKYRIGGLGGRRDTLGDFEAVAEFIEKLNANAAMDVTKHDDADATTDHLEPLPPAHEPKAKAKDDCQCPGTKSVALQTNRLAQLALKRAHRPEIFTSCSPSCQLRLQPQMKPVLRRGFQRHR